MKVKLKINLVPRTTEEAVFGAILLHLSPPPQHPCHAPHSFTLSHKHKHTHSMMMTMATGVGGAVEDSTLLISDIYKGGRHSRVPT